VDERRNELNMIFQFDVVGIDRQRWRKKPWTWRDVKAIYTRYDKALDVHSWNTSSCPTMTTRAWFLTSVTTPRVSLSFGKSVGDDTADAERHTVHLSRPMNWG